MADLPDFVKQVCQQFEGLVVGMTAVKDLGIDDKSRMQVADAARGNLSQLAPSSASVPMQDQGKGSSIA